MTQRLLPRLCLCLALWPTATPAFAVVGDIPWNRSLTITRTSADDDIKNVFRSILQANGLSVSFGPAVRDTVSFHMEQVPIQQAFEQVIDQHHLTYSYNDSTKTVFINAPSGGASDAKNSAFITLSTVSYQDVVQAMNNLGLGLGGLKYDAASRTLAVSGDEGRVKQIQTLVENLESSRRRGGKDSAASLGPEEVKVIPLRFTDVGPSTRQFQGKTVTVPGIADTLKSVLGLDETPPAGGGAAATPTATSPYGHPRISIDPRTNSVVVQGAQSAIAAVEKIVKQLDRPLQMVQIEVLIVTANVGVARELGVNWRGSQVNVGNPNSSLAADTGVSPNATSGGSGSGSGGGGTTGGIVQNGSNGQLFTSNGLDALSLLP